MSAGRRRAFQTALARVGAGDDIGRARMSNRRATSAACPYAGRNYFSAKVLATGDAEEQIRYDSVVMFRVVTRNDANRDRPTGKPKKRR